MSTEIEQLKQRIDDSGLNGIPTAQVRDDYEPAGDLMMMGLLDSAGYVQRKISITTFEQEWRIFRRDFAPF